jgi:hypothetical protein
MRESQFLRNPLVQFLLPDLYGVEMGFAQLKLASAPRRPVSGDTAND